MNIRSDIKAQLLPDIFSRDANSPLENNDNQTPIESANAVAYSVKAFKEEEKEYTKQFNDAVKNTDRIATILAIGRCLPNLMDAFSSYTVNIDNIRDTMLTDIKRSENVDYVRFTWKVYVDAWEVKLHKGIYDVLKCATESVGIKLLVKKTSAILTKTRTDTVQNLGSWFGAWSAFIASATMDVLSFNQTKAGGVLGPQVSSAIRDFYAVGSPPGKFLSIIYNFVPALYRLNAKHIIDLSNHLINTVNTIITQNPKTKDIINHTLIPMITKAYSHIEGLLRLNRSIRKSRNVLEKDMFSVYLKLHQTANSEFIHKIPLPKANMLSEDLKDPSTSANFQAVLEKEKNNINKMEIYKMIKFLDNPDSEQTMVFSPVQNTTKYRSHYSVALSRLEDNKNEIKIEIIKNSNIAIEKHDKYMEIGVELLTISDMWNYIIANCCTMLRNLTKMEISKITANNLIEST